MTPYTCSLPQGCGGTVDECDCAEQIAREERESVKELLCETCGLESPFWIFDDCKKCCAALIAVKPAAWNSNRKFYESRPECAELDREIERQLNALATLTRECA
jgi:hypothetical protein